MKILYKGYEIYCGADTVSFEGALGILRLSHKYQMEHLKSCILKLLRRSWPLDYTVYKMVFNSLTDTQKSSRISQSIKLINAARLTACYDLLPAAFFELTNADWETWTPEVGDGAEPLCLGDWVRLMRGKVLWAERLRTLECAGISHNYKAYIWDDPSRDSGGQPMSIFETRSEFDACKDKPTRQGHQENVDYCAVTFTNLKSLVGRKTLDGYSVVDGCKSWTFETFQAEAACEGCAKWMDSLIADKELEIWENVVADFDLPQMNLDGYTTTSLKLLL